MADDDGKIIPLSEKKEKKPKTRGSKSASIEHNCTASKEMISKVIGQHIKYLGRESPTTPEEFAERLNQFFAECSEEGSFPTVEKMALALGTYRKQLWEWEHGEGVVGKLPGIRNMISRAKQIMSSIDAEMAIQGKIPVVVYIFRAKNFYGMADKVSEDLESRSPLGELKDPNEIAKRYKMGIEGAADTDSGTIDSDNFNIDYIDVELDD